MQHGVVAHKDRKVAGLVGCVEAESVAVIRHRGSHVPDRKRGNRSMQAGDSPTIKAGHASKCRQPGTAPTFDLTARHRLSGRSLAAEP
jgi:hypothetical protein